MYLLSPRIPSPAEVYSAGDFPYLRDRPSFHDARSTTPRPLRPEFRVGENRIALPFLATAVEVSPTVPLTARATSTEISRNHVVTETRLAGRPLRFIAIAICHRRGEIREKDRYLLRR